MQTSSSEPIQQCYLLLRAAAPKRVASSNGGGARHALQVQTHNTAECMSLLENVMAAGCARRFKRPDTPHGKRTRPTGRAAQHLCHRACNTAPELHTCRTASNSNCATHSDNTSCAFQLSQHGSLQLAHHGNYRSLTEAPRRAEPAALHSEERQSSSPS